MTKGIDLSQMLNDQEILEKNQDEIDDQIKDLF